MVPRGSSRQRSDWKVAVLAIVALLSTSIISLGSCAKQSFDSDNEDVSVRQLKGRPLYLSRNNPSIKLKKYSQVVDEIRQDKKFGSRGRIFLVRSDEGRKSTVYKQLSKISSFVQYLPYDTFQVLLTSEEAKLVVELDGVTGLYGIHADMKCQPSLLSQNKEPRPSKMRRTIENSDGFERTLLVSFAGDIVAEDIHYICQGYDTFSCNARLSPKARRLALHVTDTIKVSIARRCIDHPLVTWVEERKEVYAFNKYSSSIIQGFDNSTKPHQPFWDAGLTGDGEIIGISDTGVDTDSCFFNDSHVALPTCSGWGFVNETECINYNHRKIVSYRVLPGSEFGDEFQGHGTHVSGSALGAIADPGSIKANFRGMAPAAKLSFDDVSKTLNRSNSLNVPNDLYADLFPHAYAVGARIHSLSFGSDSTDISYDSMAYDVDRFMFDHPDHLILIAAGNSGPDLLTVTSPAIAKNSLTVGASGHSLAALLEYGDLTFPLLRVVAGPDSSVNATFEYLLADFGAAVDPAGAEHWTGNLVVPDNYDACDPINSTSALLGKVALILLGACRFETSALNVQLGGAIAAVFINSVVGLPLYVMDGTVNNITIPAMLVSAEDGSRLLTLMESGDVTVTIPAGTVVDESSGKQAVDRVAYFSSHGPLWDFRSKPDVTCPGEYIHSAEAHGNGPVLQCGAVVEMSGTSMATPICAGAATLIRQYFRDGFYAGSRGASGRRGAGESLHASGALVKAVLIQGATPIQSPKVVSDKLLWAAPPVQVPAVSQGYGRVDLSRSLPLADSHGPDFNLTVWDDINTEVSDSESFKVCLRVLDSKGSLRVTIAWTDPPSSQYAGRNLVNDLDLTVTSGASGQYWLGNTPKAYNSLTNFVSAYDRLNNVEQVTLPAVAGDYVAVRVFGASIPIAPQRFAMVVTGPYAEADPAACSGPSAACPKGCSGNGECRDGRCSCDPLWSGPDCGVKNFILACNDTLAINVRADGWAYIVLDTPLNTSWQVDIMLTDPTSGFPDVRSAFGRLPTESDSFETDYYNILENGTFLGISVVCSQECIYRYASASHNLWVIALTSFEFLQTFTEMKLICLLPPPSTTPPPIPPYSTPPPPSTCSVAPTVEICCTRAIKNPAALVRVRLNAVSALSSITVWRDGAFPSPVPSLDIMLLRISIGYENSVTDCEISRSNISYGRTSGWNNRPEIATADISLIVNESPFEEWLLTCGSVGNRIEIAMPYVATKNISGFDASRHIYVKLCTVPGEVGITLNAKLRIQIEG